MTCSNHQLVTNHINSSHTQQLRHSIHWGRNENGTMHTTKLNNSTSQSHCTPAWTTWLSLSTCSTETILLWGRPLWTVSLSQVSTAPWRGLHWNTRPHALSKLSGARPGTVCVQNRAHPWWRLLSGEQQLLGYGDALHQQQTAWALASGFHLQFCVWSAVVLWS